jgi:endonuclease/exonuclease/phosphatase family metal-dependent hydrolase
MNRLDSFSILSLNTFGVPFYLSLNRIRRLSGELNRLAPNLLCLQEIQQNAYLPRLQEGLSSYPNFAFSRNRFAPQGGLFTASTRDCKMISSSFLPFPNQGQPLSIGFSDWALNKGVLITILESHERGFVILNTHLQANYLADWRLSNKQTQIQLDQVNYLTDLTDKQPQDAWVVVCGDFNFPRQAPGYQRMLSQSDLTDAFADDPRPTYLPFPLVSAKWHTSLDYIFYRAPKGDSTEITVDIMPVLDASAKLPFRRFLTDHQALILHLCFN